MSFLINSGHELMPVEYIFCHVSDRSVWHASEFYALVVSAWPRSSKPVKPTLLRSLRGTNIAESAGELQESLRCCRYIAKGCFRSSSRVKWQHSCRAPSTQKLDSLRWLFVFFCLLVFSTENVVENSCSVKPLFSFLKAFSSLELGKLTDVNHQYNELSYFFFK